MPSEQALGAALSYVTQWMSFKPHSINSYKFASAPTDEMRKVRGEYRGGGDDGRGRREERRRWREEVEEEGVMEEGVFGGLFGDVAVVYE